MKKNDVYGCEGVLALALIVFLKYKRNNSEKQINIEK